MTVRQFLATAFHPPVRRQSLTSTAESSSPYASIPSDMSWDQPPIVVTRDQTKPQEPQLVSSSSVQTTTTTRYPQPPSQVARLHSSRHRRRSSMGGRYTHKAGNGATTPHDPTTTTIGSASRPVPLLRAPKQQGYHHPSKSQHHHRTKSVAAAQQPSTTTTTATEPIWTENAFANWPEPNVQAEPVQDLKQDQQGQPLQHGDETEVDHKEAIQTNETPSPVVSSTQKKSLGKKVCNLLPERSTHEDHEKLEEEPQPHVSETKRTTETMLVKTNRRHSLKSIVLSMEVPETTAEENQPPVAVTPSSASPPAARFSLEEESLQTASITKHESPQNTSASVSLSTASSSQSCRTTLTIDNLSIDKLQEQELDWIVQQQMAKTSSSSVTSSASSTVRSVSHLQPRRGQKPTHEPSNDQEPPPQSSSPAKKSSPKPSTVKSLQPSLVQPMQLDPTTANDSLDQIVLLASSGVAAAPPPPPLTVSQIQVRAPHNDSDDDSSLPVWPTFDPEDNPNTSDREPSFSLLLHVPPLSQDDQDETTGDDNGSFAPAAGTATKNHTMNSTMSSTTTEKGSSAKSFWNSTNSMMMGQSHSNSHNLSHMAVPPTALLNTDLPTYQDNHSKEHGCRDTENNPIQDNKAPEHPSNHVHSLSSTHSQSTNKTSPQSEPVVGNHKNVTPTRPVKEPKDHTQIDNDHNRHYSENQSLSPKDRARTTKKASTSPLVQKHKGSFLARRRSNSVRRRTLLDDTTNQLQSTRTRDTTKNSGQKSSNSKSESLQKETFSITNERGRSIAIQQGHKTRRRSLPPESTGVSLLDQEGNPLLNDMQAEKQRLDADIPDGENMDPHGTNRYAPSPLTLARTLPAYNTTTTLLPQEQSPNVPESPPPVRVPVVVTSPQATVTKSMPSPSMVSHAKFQYHQAGIAVPTRTPPRRAPHVHFPAETGKEVEGPEPSRITPPGMVMVPTAAPMSTQPNTSHADGKPSHGRQDPAVEISMLTPVTGLASMPSASVEWAPSMVSRHTNASAVLGGTRWSRRRPGNEQFPSSATHRRRNSGEWQWVMEQVAGVMCFLDEEEERENDKDKHRRRLSERRLPVDDLGRDQRRGRAPQDEDNEDTDEETNTTMTFSTVTDPRYHTMGKTMEFEKLLDTACRY